MDIKQCYRRLELSPTATMSETRQAYKKLVKNWHPDKFEPGSPIKVYAEERLKLINAAYDLIRKHQSSRHSRAGIDGDVQTKKRAQSVVYPKDCPQDGNNIGGEWFRFINRMVLSLKRILYPCHSSRTETDPAQRHYKSNQRIKKPLKRVLKDLKSNHPRKITGAKLNGNGFNTIYSLRDNYGPRHRRGLAPVSEVAATNKNQRIAPISRIVPIRKVQ